MSDIPAAAPFDSDAYLAMVRAKDAFSKALGVEVVAASPERAETRVRVSEEHLNFFGVGHGGLVFTLADTAFGAAANAGGRRAAMIDAHITMTAAVRLGEELTASAERISESRRLAVYRVTVRRRAAGGAEAIISSFTGTVYVSDRPPPSERDLA